MKFDNKRRKLRQRRLASDDSGHSENVATFDLTRVHKEAHHFQRKDYEVLQRTAVYMHRHLDEASLEIAMKRPTMSIRSYLRQMCKDYGTWREESELQQILGGTNPKGFLHENSSDDESVMDKLQGTDDEDTKLLFELLKRKVSPKRKVVRNVVPKSRGKPVRKFHSVIVNGEHKVFRPTELRKRWKRLDQHVARSQAASSSSASRQPRSPPKTLDTDEDNRPLCHIKKWLGRVI